MNNLIWSGLVLLLLLSGCGWDGTPTRDNDFVPLTSMEIIADTKAIRDSRTIAAKTSTKLRVKGNFSGQFTDDITDRVVWSSNATDKADFVTAADPSRVTGKSPGTATLTAAVGGLTSTFTLTVSSATISTMTISSDKTTVAKGLNTKFAVIGTFSDSSTQDLTFDAIWASSALSVATIGDIVDVIVDEDRVVQRVVKAIADGTAKISATFEGVGDTKELIVTEPVLLSITVSTPNSSVLSLSSAPFKATGNFSDNTNPDITSQVTWSSSSTDIATFVPGGAGAVKTLAEGTTVITATLNNASGTPIKGTANLKVTGGNLNKIVLSKDNTIIADNGNITLVKDTSVRMIATGTFSNGSNRDVSGVVEWSVANKSIANVSNTPGSNLALLNATAVTTPLIPTIVTAKSGTAPPVTFNLAVTAPTPQSLVINTPSGFTDLTANNSARFTATATFSDNSTQDVTLNATWASSNEAAATIGTSGLAKGQVTGKVTGNPTINATFVGAGGLTRSAPPVTIAVKTRTIQSLSISPNVSTVVSGNQVPFKALANYSDGTTNVDVTEVAAWTIDKPNVAILADNTNQPGQVVGVDTGTAILTATFDGKSATANITVP